MVWQLLLQDVLSERRQGAQRDVTPCRASNRQSPSYLRKGDWNPGDTDTHTVRVKAAGWHGPAVELFVTHSSSALRNSRNCVLSDKAWLCIHKGFREHSRQCWGFQFLKNLWTFLSRILLVCHNMDFQLKGILCSFLPSPFPVLTIQVLTKSRR